MAMNTSHWILKSSDLYVFIPITLLAFNTYSTQSNPNDSLIRCNKSKKNSVNNGLTLFLN